MSIPATFPTAAEAAKAGWFSRRHRTSEAHRQNQMDREVELNERKARIAAQHEATERKKKKVKDA